MNKTVRVTNKDRRSHRTRVKISNVSVYRPRLSVYRSERSIAAQIIDDGCGRTLVAVHSREAAKAKNRLQQAEMLGALIAKKALDKKIDKVVFDRGAYKYHGLVKALADGARKGGLIF